MTAKPSAALAAKPRRLLIPPTPPHDAPRLGAVVHALGGRTMGTTWSVRLCGASTLDRAAVARDIQLELDAVVAEMSTWEPASDLCRFNRAAAGHWQALPPAFFEVLEHGIGIARLSDGAFDPTAGALVDAWGFGPTPQPSRANVRVPDGATLASARSRVGWQRIELDAGRRAARQPGGVALDFSAIAKGHGVDRVARHLSARGFDSHLVEVGGELRGTGLKPDGRPWWVALEAPPSEQAGDAPTPTWVALHGLSVATSGDYRRRFEHDGVRYSHTIDPRDGRPIRHDLASVTVLHAECMTADALSTALTVMGVRDGLAFAHRHGIAALFVERAASRTGMGIETDFVETASPALAAMLK